MTNVTAAGALLTGIFGSTEVVKAAIGDDAEEVLALATVGSAIAIAFITAGTIVPVALRARTSRAVTVGGLLLAAIVTLTGAVGQIYVITLTGARLDLGWGEMGIWLAGVLAVALLAEYARTTLLATLDDGVIEAEKSPSETLEAARLIVKALEAQDETEHAAVTAEFEQAAERYSGVGTSPGDEPRSTVL